MKKQVLLRRMNKPFISGTGDDSDKLLKDNRLLYFCVLLYSLLIVTYYIVSVKFDYSEVSFVFKFDFIRLLISTCLLSIVLMLSKKINDSFVLFIYYVVVLLLFLGEAVCFAFYPDNNPTILFGVFFSLLLLVFTQNIKVKFRDSKITKDPMPILLLISFVLFIPFLFQYYDKININNLLLVDVYETRTLFREESNQFLGYFIAPLSRIILPVLIAMSIKNKRYGYLIICSIMVLFIFLCGALKSILFGLIAVLFLYKGDYMQKIQRLLKWLTIIILAGILIYLLVGDLTIVNIIRRVFFVPSRLGSLYVDYFASRPTFLTHSPLGFNLSSDTYGSSLSMFFGETVLHSPGLNANVGLITEGFVSFGIIGMLFFAFISVMILNYFRWLNINPIFAGIILVYIYYMNTSFLSILLLTHGLAFLMIFSFFFMRDKNKVEHG